MCGPLRAPLDICEQKMAKAAWRGGRARVKSSQFRGGIPQR